MGTNSSNAKTKTEDAIQKLQKNLIMVNRFLEDPDSMASFLSFPLRNETNTCFACVAIKRSCVKHADDIKSKAVKSTKLPDGKRNGMYSKCGILLGISIGYGITCKGSNDFLPID